MIGPSENLRGLVDCNDSGRQEYTWREACSNSIMSKKQHMNFPGVEPTSLWSPIKSSMFCSISAVRTKGSFLFRRVRKIPKSVRPSVCQHGTTRLPLDGFSWIFMLLVGWGKLSTIFNFHYNWTGLKGYFIRRPLEIFDHISLNSFGTRNVSDKSCRRNQNTHFVFNNFFSRKSYLLWDNVEKYCRAGQTT